MALEPIDLLVDVSKVLYNERIIEQRKQIEKLKKQIDDSKIVKYKIYLSGCDEIIAPVLFSIEKVLKLWLKEVHYNDYRYYTITICDEPPNHNKMAEKYGLIKLTYFKLRIGNYERIGEIAEVRKLQILDFTDETKMIIYNKSLWHLNLLIY